MTKTTEQPESSPAEEIKESVTPESQPAEKSVTEDSQPPVTDEKTDSSTEKDETAVEAIKKALSEDESEEEKIPDEVAEDVKPESRSEVEDEADDDIYSEPAGLKPKAQERFRNLVEDNKSKSVQLGEAQGALKEIHKTVQDSNMTPEEFGYLIDYGRTAVSKDPKELEYALQTAQNEIIRISQLLGKEVPGVDLLEGHPELQKRVDDYELSREDALRIAKSERELASYKQAQNAQQEQQQTTSNQKNIEQQSLDQVRAYMGKMKSTDINFSAKEAKLVEQAAKVRENYPPEQWPTVIRDLYETMGFDTSAQKQNLKTSAPTPIQSTTSTVGSQVPKTMQEAVMLGLENA
ncbi:MAG: hypothetical protein CME35_00795 [Gramella sp.]|nr:hypothetical protein [Christiangramia sp.]